MKYILTLCLVSLIQGNASEIPKKNPEVKSLLEKRKAKQEAFQKEQKILEKRKAFKEKHEAKQNVKSNEAAFKEEADSCLKTVQKISKNSELLKSKYDVKHKYNFKQNSLEVSFKDESGKHSTSFSCITGKALQSIKQTHNADGSKALSSTKQKKSMIKVKPKETRTYMVSKGEHYAMHKGAVTPFNEALELNKAEANYKSKSLGASKNYAVKEFQNQCMIQSEHEGFNKDFHHVFKNKTLYWIPTYFKDKEKTKNIKELENLAKQYSFSIKSRKCSKFELDRAAFNFANKTVKSLK